MSIKTTKKKVNSISEKITKAVEQSGYTVYVPKSAKKKVSKSKRILVDKPFNHGTMSNAAFFGWLRSRLRKMSQAWKPIQEVKKAAKRPYTGENKRRKFSYECSGCLQLFSDKEVAVHHIIPAGTLKSFDDIGTFCKNLFVEKNLLILLCDGCHTKEHEELDKLKIVK